MSYKTKQNHKNDKPLYIIYRHTCTITNKSYIGKTIAGLDARLTLHLSDAARGTTNHFHRAIRKYGIDSFNSDILYIAFDKCDDYLYLVEKDIIAAYNTFNEGYNSTPGGRGTGSGKNHPRWGMKHAPESIIKMSDAHKGVKLSEECKAKMSKAHKGKVFSEEHKANLGKTKKGNQYNKGRVHTTEAKLKMSLAQSGKNNPSYDTTIYKFKHKNGDIFIGTQYYLRIKYALNRGNLSKVITGKHKTTKGWSII